MTEHLDTTDGELEHRNLSECCGARTTTKEGDDQRSALHPRMSWYCDNCGERCKIYPVDARTGQVLA